MIGMDDLMASLHGESTAIGVVHDCESARHDLADSTPFPGLDSGHQSRGSYQIKELSSSN